MQQQLAEKNTNLIPSELDENGYSKEFAEAIMLKLKKGKFIEPPSQDIEDMLNWLES